MTYKNQTNASNIDIRSGVIYNTSNHIHELLHLQCNCKKTAQKWC